VDSARFPEQQKSPFMCPLCGVVAQQDWEELTNYMTLDENPYLCRCEECSGVSLWYQGRMLVPATGGVQAPNRDLPEGIQRDYNEARAVAAYSPRAAAALLRLAIEKLCVVLNQRSMKLDDHIAALVAKGLNEDTTLMLDAVRIGGNNGAHPVDRIGIATNPQMLRTLFWLVNEIADELITKPKRRAEALSWIPEDERTRITNRNNKARESAVRNVDESGRNP
jgi:Domain of unknown function (DUF4145)